jgi:hypothetical protein
VRRLEQDQGGGDRRQLGQERPAGRGFRRREAGEQEAVGRQAGQQQPDQWRRGAGQAGDGQPLVPRRPGQLVAGVASPSAIRRRIFGRISAALCS